MRKEALRMYFVEVIRDLGLRGVIRVARGESLENILAREASTLLKELQADLGEVLGGITIELLSGAAQIVGGALQRQVENIFGAAARRISEAIKSPK